MGATPYDDEGEDQVQNSYDDEDDDNSCAKLFKQCNTCLLPVHCIDLKSCWGLPALRKEIFRLDQTDGD